MTLVAISETSALRQAIKDGDGARALELVQSGIYPLVENGRSHLQRAIKHCPDDLVLIHELLARDLEVVKCVDRAGDTPMITAAHYANTAVIDLLVAKKADVSYTDKDGRCPLYHAAIHSAFCLGAGGNRSFYYPRTLEAMQMLVRHGASVNFSTRLYPSILGNYIGAWLMTGDLNVVTFLVAEGADVPTKEAVWAACQDVGGLVLGAIDKGLEERQLKAARGVAAVELAPAMPPPIVALICGYVYQPW